MSYDEEFIARAEKARSRIREITPMELGNAMPQPIIIDVREKDEFERGHLEGAKLISQGMLEEQVAKVVPDASTPIVVYCAGGNRGALAADMLQNMGYQKISSLKGGLRSWLESGGLVETGSTQSILYRGSSSWRPAVKVKLLQIARSRQVGITRDQRS